MEKLEDHIALPVLYGHIRGTAALGDVSQRHLEKCSQCQQNADWLGQMVEFGAREGAYEPPGWALANALRVFQLKKPRMVRFAKEIVAALVFDSFSEPAPLGVRRRDLPARQALYRAEGLELDLKIQFLDEEKGVIIGQVLAMSEDRSRPDNLEIALSQEGEVIQTSMTNRWGEFMFENLPRGNYELQVYFPDKMVKLPPLPVTQS